MLNTALSGLLLIFSLFTLSETGVDSNLDFLEQAKAAMEQENWAELERLALAEIEKDESCFEARIGLAYAQAGLRRIEECANTLKCLEKLGPKPVSAAFGGGEPLDRVVDIVYSACWADFRPDVNKKAWGPLFEAFHDRDRMAVAASRLLMAGLEEGSKEEAGRYAQWFKERIASCSEDVGREVFFKHFLVQGFLRAGIADQEVLENAAFCYSQEWKDAEESHGNIEDPLVRRERCDIVTDRYHNDLALACWLAKAFDPDDNPLAAKEAVPGALFEEITVEAGLAELRAGRVAAADYDRDGYPDLCFSGRLFRNLKGKRFEEMTREAGLGSQGAGALFFDYDNDGELDLLVTAQPHPILYRNRGKRGKYRFEDRTAASGLDKLKLGALTEGAGALDIDGDGWIDIYLASYENPYPTGHPDLLVKNNGDGTFVDWSDVSGIRTEGPFCGRGVACADFDQDGDGDIYVSNYRLQENLLWQNDGTGRFRNVAREKGLHGVDQQGAFGHTIGSCFGDVDNDGDLDLFCANLAHPRFILQGFSNLSMLYLNQGPDSKGSFSEERLRRGIRFQETFSDPAFADYDNDGDLDLYITAVYEGVPSAFFQNDGKGFFEPVTFRARAAAFNGWGQAWFDMEGDGDLDHVVCSGSGVSLRRNRGNHNHWVKVKLRGKKRNLFGVGSRVRVITDSGRIQVREVQVGRGTQSQDPYILHFGLGPDAGSVKVEVTWPSGLTDVRTGKPDRLIEVRQ